MRIAAIGDIHCRTNTPELMHSLFHGVEQDADVLVLTGDLTDHGQPDELAILLPVLEELNLPIVAVLGNHDHECDQAEALVKMLVETGVHVLNGTAVEIGNVGFVGTKGFCGGFDELIVQPFGERALKTFIMEGINEAVQLENALAKLDCPHKIGVLHYSPIKETLQGEPPELFPFLGNGRLGNALDRHGVEVIFHGHAHHGSPEGSTRNGVPVRNVSRFVQTRFTDHAYCVFNTEIEGERAK